MESWIEFHKPAAAPHAHLLLARLMWTVVGAGLAAAGVWATSCRCGRRPFWR
jgi:hypothetical protein